MPKNSNQLFSMIDWSLILDPKYDQEDFTHHSKEYDQNLIKLNHQIKTLQTKSSEVKMSNQSFKLVLAQIQAYQTFKKLYDLNQTQKTTGHMLNIISYNQTLMQYSLNYQLHYYQHDSYKPKFIQIIQSQIDDFIQLTPNQKINHNDWNDLINRIPEIDINDLNKQTSVKTKPQNGEVVDIATLTQILQDENYNLTMNYEIFDAQPYYRKNFIQKLRSQIKMNNHLTDYQNRFKYLLTNQTYRHTSAKNWFIILRYGFRFFKNIRIKIINNFCQNYLQKPNPIWIENLYQMNLINQTEKKRLSNLPLKNPQLPSIIQTKKH